MQKRRLLLILLIILYSLQLAHAATYTTLSPDSGHSNQNQINEALKNGNVYLNAGIYEVDNTIIISSDRVLSGDSNAIIRVYSGSSQWFTGATGVISCSGIVDNVEISGFQIDGNIGSIPKSYANSRADTDHDCEKLIILRGASNKFAKNIKIHNLKLYNSFSDGIYIIFGENVQCYDNFISNCQHEGIYYSCLKNSEFFRNKIAGICSDAARLDNCVNCKVYDNYFFSYNGESYGQYKGGQAGLQIANAGSSHGYDASNKPQKTDNVEVYNNTFADPGRQAIWLHNYDGNVYVHDNTFVNADVLETMGIPIGDISYTNQPSVELSEKVFSGIFDILDMEFTDSGRTDQTADDIYYSIQETEQGRISGGIKIIGFNDVVYIDGVPYIPDNNSVIVKYEAVKAPSFSWNNTGVSKIDKDVNIRNKNGTITATLTVKMDWYTLSTDSTGETKKKHKTSTATFTDTITAPEVFNRPHEIKGFLYEYPTYTVASIPHNGLTQVEYEYDGKTVNHVYLLGEQHRDSNGIIYTNFSNVDYWKGDLPHSGEFLYINGSFDPEKLTVTAYTPYENFSVTTFNYTKKDYPTQFFADWLFPSFGLFVILWFGAWYYLKKIFY